MKHKLIYGLGALTITIVGYLGYRTYSSNKALNEALEALDKTFGRAYIKAANSNEWISPDLDPSSSNITKCVELIISNLELDWDSELTSYQKKLLTTRRFNYIKDKLRNTVKYS